LNRKPLSKDLKKLTGISFPVCVFIIADEHVDPDVSGNTHNVGHKNNERHNDGNKRCHQGTSEKEIGNNKSCYAKSDAHAIADIHCTKEKRRFDLVF